MRIQALTPSDAGAIASWRYPGSYSTYDFTAIGELAHDHWAVTDGGGLVGYCCFGAPARVRGAKERSGTLDVGYGLSPERMGQHTGRRFVGAILEFGTQRWRMAEFRLHILDWNARSRKLAENLGFALESIVRNEEGTFLVMVRDIDC